MGIETFAGRGAGVAAINSVLVGAAALGTNLVARQRNGGTAASSAEGEAGDSKIKAIVEEVVEFIKNNVLDLV